MSTPMFDKASVETDGEEGVVDFTGNDFEVFVSAAKKHRIWDRESKVRSSSTNRHCSRQ
ncbi:hypothetical protein [Neorhodopirellula pilleata]|nr:hypothetical protein [Neorhodopirellula pilleata]